MALTIAELIARIKIEGADAAKANLGALKKDFHDAGDAARMAGGHLSTMGGALGRVVGGALELAGKAVSATTAIAGLSAALAVAGSVAAFNTAARLESLTRGLASVSKDASDLTTQMARLREVAKLPGLGFEEAVSGSLRLQAAGVSALLAERSLSAFGNALATVGRGKADLDGVTLALQQIAAKGKVSAEEINQINERVPQIRNAMKNAFGTADTEALSKMGVTAQRFIEGVVGQLEKLPKVAGGAMNAIENLGDKLSQALTPLGQGLLAGLAASEGPLYAFLDNVQAKLTQVGEVIAATASSGVLVDVLKSLGAGFESLFGDDFQQGVTRFAATVAAVVANLPDAFKQVGKYLSEVTSVIGENLTRVFDYIEARTKSIRGAIGDIFAGAMASPLGAGGEGGGKSGVMKAGFSDDMGAFLRKTLGFLAGASGMGGLSMLGISPMSLMAPGGGAALLDKAKPLQLRSLPEMPFGGIMDKIMSDADAFAARISKDIKPLPGLPGGLTFGGNPGMSGPASVTEKLDKIVRNTKATADPLSLRAAATGAGAAGVTLPTAAELYGGSGGSGGNGRGQSRIQVEVGGAAAQELQRFVHNIAEQVINKALSSGFRPR